MGMDLSKSGLDETCQKAVEAMMLAHDANRWQDVVNVGDAWVDARGEMSALAAVWYAHGLLGVGRIQDARKWAGVAARTIPDKEVNGKLAARMTHAQVLASAGFPAKARRVLKEVLHDAVQYTEGEALEQLGYVTLAVTNKWDKGWALQEARLSREGRGLPPNVRPWNGTDQVPVVVLHEQGIGDAVLAARWLPWIEAVTGHKPTWYGPNLMHRWISEVAHVGNISQAADSGEPMTGLYALSLPLAAKVRTPIDVIKPYAPSALVRDRSVRRFNPDRLTVGVCWKGSATNMLDFERSYPALEFAEIWQPIDGVEFMNLCHEAELPADAPFPKRTFSDVYDTGEVVSALDLVISVDTAVVHIAGSLGIPTLALLPTKLDWRYQWPFGGGTPFYQSVTAVRRQTSVDTFAIHKSRQLLERWVKGLRKKVTA